MRIGTRSCVLIVLLLAATALAPVASAGSESKPEIKDPEGDHAYPTGAYYGDIVAAWIEKETPASFDMVIKFRQLDATAARQSSHRFDFVYRDYGYNAFAFIDAEGGTGFSANRYEKDTFEKFEGNATTGAVRYGSPGYVSITYPKAFLEANLSRPPPGLDDLVLDELSAFSWEIKANIALCFIGCANDFAESDETYTLKPPPGAAVESGSESGPSTNDTIESEDAEPLAESSVEDGTQSGSVPAPNSTPSAPVALVLGVAGAVALIGVRRRA